MKPERAILFDIEAWVGPLIEKLQGRIRELEAQVSLSKGL
jgi:hypothetical protein